MGIRILIAPDKFKGTLTATEAATAIAKGWKKSRPKDRLTMLPISDGGDGFGELLGRALGAKTQTTSTLNAAHHPVAAKWWWHAPSKTAILESARVIGLAMLPPGRFHPFDLDTYGLGMVLKAAAKKGAKRVLIGIGGSATNDGGFGMARALGWRFLNTKGAVTESWTDLGKLDSIELPPAALPFKEVIVAVDVQNQLLGPKGCSRVYGPQKGLKPANYPKADLTLGALAKAVRQLWGTDIAKEPGTGAAGGLGFGLRAFAGARLEPGFALFARHVQLEKQLKKADILITGEGSIDASSLMGKGVGELVQQADGLKVKCIGMAGVLGQKSRLAKQFKAVGCLCPDLASVEEAKSRPAHWLETLSAKMASDLSPGR
ncbi:MAG TPA: glycerate kinase [Roseimicrobium sp.]|nr:glycerate kinase [Roseimicrobium sp.]